MPMKLWPFTLAEHLGYEVRLTCSGVPLISVPEVMRVRVG